MALNRIAIASISRRRSASTTVTPAASATELKRRRQTMLDACIAAGGFDQNAAYGN